MLARRAAVLGALGFAIAAACGGGESAPSGSPADAGTDGQTFGAGPCASCVDAACAVPRNACSADPSCAAWLACRAACPATGKGEVDPSCLSGCALPSGSEGTALHAAFSSCAAQAAQGCAACGATDAGGGDADAGACKLPTRACDPSTETDQCTKCTRDRCCESFSKVAKPSSIGYALAICLGGCNQVQACFDACFAKHPEGVSAWGEYMACYQVSCDPDLGCVTTADDCDRCTFRECGCEYSACFEQAECFLTWRCIQKCTPTDAACTKACIDLHPTAKGRIDAYGTCIVSRCLAFCGQ